MKRFGQVIGIDADRIDEYIELHDNIWPEITEALKAASISNYSIFHIGDQLFGYFEYHGPDEEYDERMAILADAPRMKEWWAAVGELQRPDPLRPPGAFWTDLPSVFHMP